VGQFSSLTNTNAELLGVPMGERRSNELSGPNCRKGMLATRTFGANDWDFVQTSENVLASSISRSPEEKRTNTSRQKHRPPKDAGVPLLWPNNLSLIAWALLILGQYYCSKM
jgi:hypothetical protein